MKFTLKTSLVLVPAFFCLLLSSGRAYAQTVSISCSPCSGPQGTVVQVNLSGWGSIGVAVVAATDPGGGGSESISSGCTPVNGACTAPVYMPGATTPTTYYFVA